MSDMIGKDRDVKETINIVKKILSGVGFHLVEESIINPVRGIWSIHLKDSDSLFYTNGKGSTKDGALASAYCEFLERVGSGFFFDDYTISTPNKLEWVYSPDEVLVYRDSYRDKLLSKDLWDFYDPDNTLTFETFIDSGRCDTDSLVALPFFMGDKDDKVFFPVELLKNIYASNGLSAGNSRTEALVQGLSESIERGVKSHIIREGLSLPTISDSFLSKLGLLEIKNDIESFGYPVLVKDASLGGRFPVIAVLLLNQESGTVLSSFGAHPNVAVAINRTLTELLQGRKIEALDEFSELVFNLEECDDDANIESHFINSTGLLHYNIISDTDNPVTLWEFSGNRGDELKYLEKILENEKYAYFQRAYDLGNMWVSQVIIPGLSEIYPIEDLEWDFRNRLGLFRKLLESFALSKENLLSIINIFDSGILTGDHQLFSTIGIAIDSKNILSTITFDEVEATVLSLLGRKDEVRDFIVNRMNIAGVNKDRKVFWNSLNVIIKDLDIDTVKLFGKENTDLAFGFLNGVIPEKFFPSLGDSFSKAKEQVKVMEVYQKYRRLRSI